MKDRIAKSVFWIVWSKGGVQIVSLFSTLFVARLLAPEDYGIMALAGIWIFPMSLLAEMGLGSAIVQFRDLDRHDLNACFWLTMILAVLCYGILFLVAPWIAYWFNAPILTNVLRVSGGILPLIAVRIVPDSLLRKQLAFDKVSKAELAGAAVTIPVMLALAWQGAGIWTLVAGTLVAPLVQSAVTLWFLGWIPGRFIGSRRFQEIVCYSLSTLGSKVCWAAYRQTDALVLGKLYGDVALGLYAMAKQLATLPVDKISTVVNQLASPIMAELQDNREAMRASLLRGLRLVSSLAFPMCIGMIFVAHDLVHVALTDKWISAVPVLQILCLYAAIRSVDVLLPPVLMARFRTRFLFSYAIALLIFMPLMFWFGAVWAGVLGVATAWVVGYPLILSRMAHETWKELDLSWKTSLRQIVPAVVATTSMSFFLQALNWGFTDWSGNWIAVRLILMVITGAMVYTTTLFFMDANVWREMQEVLGWALGKQQRIINRVQEQAV